MAKDVVLHGANAVVAPMPDIYGRTASAHRKAASQSASGNLTFDPYSSGDSPKSQAQSSLPTRAPAEKSAEGFDPYNSI